MMKHAIIFGASSGIGREMAKLLSGQGYVLGLAARRVDLLEDLKRELTNKSFVRFCDIAGADECESVFKGFIEDMGGVDLVVISSGTGYINDELDWRKEKETIDVNVAGFACLAVLAARYFLDKKEGHLVGISSIGGLRGSRAAPAYSASKAFVSNYLEGLRCKMKKANPGITVTDIMPGFVDTEMAKGEGLFWVAPAEIAARQICRAIIKKKDRAYITRKWLFIALLMKWMPDRLYCKL
jgi:short-subunit dehydrogenase